MDKDRYKELISACYSLLRAIERTPLIDGEIRQLRRALVDAQLPCDECGGDTHTRHQRFCPVEIKTSITS